MPITMRVGDSRFGFAVQLANENGIAVDLTNATVRFYAEDRATGAVVSDKIAKITSPTEGKAIVRLDSSDIATAREVVDAEMVVTYGDGKVETFPNSGKISYRIVSNLRQ